MRFTRRFPTFLSPLVFFSTPLQGGESLFGAATFNILLNTQHMKYRLSRAHFYKSQFVVARTGEVSSYDTALCPVSALPAVFLR